MKSGPYSTTRSISECGLPSPRINEPATKAHSASGNFAATNRWAMSKACCSMSLKSKIIDQGRHEGPASRADNPHEKVRRYTRLHFQVSTRRLRLQAEKQTRRHPRLQRANLPASRHRGASKSAERLGFVC